MKRATSSSLLALALAIACQGSAFAAPLPPPPVPQSELSNAVRNRILEQDYLTAETRRLEYNTAPFGQLAEYRFDPQSPMPDAPEGNSAIVADGGLLFDSACSALSYIGNVRLNDSHLQLRAAHSLYVRLPEHGSKQSPAAAPQQPTSADRSASAPPQLHKPTPAPAAAPREQKTIAPPPVPEPLVEDKTGLSDEAPGFITAENVAVDLRDSKFLLEGRRSRPSLTLTRGQDSITLDTLPTGAGAKIFCSYQGDILFQGRHIVFTWHDSAGEEWKLVSATGPVYYKAAQHCLVAMGDTHITSPRQSLHAKRSIYIVLTPEDQPPTEAKEKQSPFSQFTSMRFKDVEYMNAYGDVHLTSAADQGRPASSARGEALQYIAASGECRIYGEPCSFAYGTYSLQTNGCVELHGDGNATVQGSEITGEYERPFATTPKGQETIRGVYKAAGPITYDAQKNSVLLPGGLSAQDAHGFFTCSGAVEIFLTAKPQPAKPREPRRGSMRMPNLAIAQQSDISHITARGGIKMHSDASATEPAYDLTCDELEADTASSTATLRSAKKAQVRARYGDYELRAHAPAKGVAEVQLLENGDLLATGKQIHATLPGDKGATTATCEESLQLRREENLLTLGKNSRITTPDAIMTANAPLQAELTPGEKAPHAPAKHPHLVYNFSGLHRATTPSGGTLRTTQASMQCEGLIEIELKPGAQMKGSDDVRQSIQVATATGRVQVAGKDATGRLLRGEGDRLDFDSATGSFHMRGKSVVLVDEFNTHTATGKGACITIDAQNNVTIYGERQITSANQIHRQMENQKKQKK